MPFTADELTNIANAALDYYFEKGTIFKQAVQKKPLVDAMERSAKTFPGGKGEISMAVKGEYGAGGTNDTLAGYTHDDTLNFYTPANINRAAYPWRETHIGMTMTHTELKIDGISVTETTNNSGTRNHSRREMTALANLLEDKTEDIGEQLLRGLNTMFWGDGTADAAGFAGIQSIIVDDPTAAASVGGIAQATNTWWRNRSNVGSPVTSAATNGGVLMQFLQEEMRQLRRYGPGPNLILAGSDFIGALETEMRANGYYSNNGFTQGGDITVGTLRVAGVGDVIYDPTLDDLGGTYPRRAYFIDTRSIFLMKMENEWRRNHTPARPSNQFVLHRSITCTGNIVCKQRNTSGVYLIS